MAKRTVSAIGDIIIDRVDKDKNDSVFKSFVTDQVLLTFQEIVAAVPNARWLLDSDTLTLVANQQYVEMTSDWDIDSVASLRYGANLRAIRRITREEADMLDPGRTLSGVPDLWWYQEDLSTTVKPRIYFIPKPSAAGTVTVTFGNLVDDVLTSATLRLPAKYESTLIDLTLLKVWERIDPFKDVSLIASRGMNGLEIIKRDVRRNPGGNDSLAFHRPHWDSGIRGASFPGDYDIL